MEITSNSYLSLYKTTGTLVPVVNTDVNSSLSAPDVVVTRPEESIKDSDEKEVDEEKGQESEDSEPEKEGDDVTKPDESEGAT